MTDPVTVEVVTGDPWYVGLLIGLVGAMIGAGASIWATRRVIREERKEIREERRRELSIRRAAIAAEFRLGAELLEKPYVQHAWVQVPTAAYAGGAHTLTAAHDLEFARLAVAGAIRYNALAALESNRAAGGGGFYVEDLKELVANLQRALTDAAAEIEAHL